MKLHLPRQVWKIFAGVLLSSRVPVWHYVYFNPFLLVRRGWDPTVLGWVEQKSFPQPDREDEGSNGCLQVLTREQYKISIAACKHLMGGVCPHMGCALAVVDPCPGSESKELRSPGGQRGSATPRTCGCSVGGMVLSSAGLEQVLSSAAPGCGVLFPALMHPRAAARTSSELGLRRVCCANICRALVSRTGDEDSASQGNKGGGREVVNCDLGNAFRGQGPLHGEALKAMLMRPSLLVK